ncbi:MAG TPA: hypothetical protein VNM37_11135, partial [Candidatus Dormibacteraeota bacterium]|nr:hypothetical protein [Candidatus Dormibacteraeota bacterium]
MQIDLVGYFTAAAGAAIYGGGTWPAAWNYSYFTTEPTINIVHHEVVEPNGVTFKAHKTREAEFIGGRDSWFRPIDTRIGPDGALYITDFYNQAVVHNDTRGTAHGPANAAVRPDRDHYFGRIWRVNHRQAKRVEVPDLAKANTPTLVKALQNPNQPVRMTAARLLVEKNDPGTPKALQPLLASWNFRGLEEAQVQALWVLFHLGKLDSEKLQQAVALDGKPAVQKNALRIIANQPASAVRPDLTTAVIRRLKDSDLRVRLQAFSTLATLPSTPEIRLALIDAYPGLDDAWLQSAALGVAARAPVECIEAAAAARKPAELAPFATQLANQVASKQDAASASRVIVALAGKPATTDPIKEAVLPVLARSLKADVLPDWSPELQRALRSLLTSPNPALPAAVLPLVARWDRGGALGDEIKVQITALTTKLKSETESDDTRAQVAASLVGVRQVSPDILPAVGQLIGSSASASLQKRVIETLGGTGDPAVGALLTGAYPKLSSDLQEAAFAQLIKRPDWALSVV